jgi:hypothetical protein
VSILKTLQGLLGALKRHRNSQASRHDDSASPKAYKKAGGKAAGNGFIAG